MVVPISNSARISNPVTSSSPVSSFSSVSDTDAGLVGVVWVKGRVVWAKGRDRATGMDDR